MKQTLTGTTYTKKERKKMLNVLFADLNSSKLVDNPEVALSEKEGICLQVSDQARPEDSRKLPSVLIAWAIRMRLSSLDILCSTHLTFRFMFSVAFETIHFERGLVCEQQVENRPLRDSSARERYPSSRKQILK